MPLVHSDRAAFPFFPRFRLLAADVRASFRLVSMRGLIGRQLGRCEQVGNVNARDFQGFFFKEGRQAAART